MRIIRGSNYDDETKSEAVVAKNLSVYYAEKISKLLNTAEGMDSLEYYRSEDDDYKLYKWEGC